MTIGRWLEGRSPRPPEALRVRLPATSELSGAALVEHLADEALAALGRARAAPGRVRESALELLVADALLTYACEAALELPDADHRLDSLLTRAAAER